MAQTADGDDMHRRVDWMVAADVVILEFLYAARDGRGNPSKQTPKTVAMNTGYSNRHTSSRCLELSRYGLVERIDDGEFRLTELGGRVIENDIPLREVNDLEPELLPIDEDADGGDNGNGNGNDNGKSETEE